MAEPIKIDDSKLLYDEAIVNRIYNHPSFKALVAEKQKFSLILLTLTLGLYILIIVASAFAPSMVGMPLAENMVTTWAIPAGFFLIIWTILVTCYYVHRTNTYFDPKTIQVLKEIGNEK